MDYDTPINEDPTSPQFETLACPNCGADLDVPDGVAILKCRFCGSKLRLKETGSVQGLALLERGLATIGENTARTAEGVARIHEQAAGRRLEAQARWKSKLVQLKARETRERGHARTLRLWTALFMALWTPATLGIGYALSISNEDSHQLLYGWQVAVASIAFFGFPLVAIVLSNRANARFQAADDALEQVRAWEHREPL